MFLNLPLEIRDVVCGSLDLMSRIKLNMALPKPDKIEWSDPDTDNFLRMMSILIKVKGYTSSNQLYGDWKQFVVDFPDDITVNALLTVHPNQRFMHDVKNDQISESKPYDIDYNYNVFYYDNLLRDLAEFATEKGFKALEINPSTTRMVSSIFIEEHTQRLFWYDLVEYTNYEVLAYLHAKFTFDIDEMINSLILAFPSMSRVRTLCEFYKIEKGQVEVLFIRALDESQLDIAQYLDTFR